MKKGTIRLIRDNEVKLQLPAATVLEKKDRTLWVKEMPLLGITDPAEKDRIAKLVRAKKFDQIPAGYFVRLGQNDNGIYACDEEAWKNHPAKLVEEKGLAEKEEIRKRTKEIYLSSRGWGDYSPVVWSGDITRPENEILAECKQLLDNANDVDNKNQGDEEILKKILAEKVRYNEPVEKVEKRNFGPGYCFNCETYCFGDCGNYLPEPTSETEMKKVREMNKELNYGIDD